MLIRLKSLVTPIIAQESVIQSYTLSFQSCADKSLYRVLDIARIVYRNLHKTQPGDEEFWSSIYIVYDKSFEFDLRIPH